MSKKTIFTVEMTEMLEKLEETGEWGSVSETPGGVIVRHRVEKGCFLMLKAGNPLVVTFHRSGESSDSPLPHHVREIYEDVHRGEPGPLDALVDALEETGDWISPQRTADRVILRKQGDRKCLLIIEDTPELKMEIFRSGESEPSPVPAEVAALRHEALRSVVPTSSNPESGLSSLRFYLVIGYLESSQVWTRTASVKKSDNTLIGNYKFSNGEEVMLLCEPNGEPYLVHHPDANRGGALGRELSKLSQLICYKFD